MLKIIRLAIIGVYFAICLFITLIACLLRPFHPDNPRLLGIIACGPILKILGIKLELENKDILYNNRPCVFISNHQSNWDIFLMGSIIPPRTVSLGKKSLVKIPVFGLFYWLSGNIIINRENRREAHKAMSNVKDAIVGKNTSVWIFPEGTRSRGRGLLPFKKGAFHVAVNAQVPIVPVTVTDYFDVLDLNSFKGTTIKMKVHPVIETKGKTTADINELLEESRKIIASDL